MCAGGSASSGLTVPRAVSAPDKRRNGFRLTDRRSSGARQACRRRFRFRCFAPLRAKSFGARRAPARRRNEGISPSCLQSSSSSCRHWAHPGAGESRRGNGNHRRQHVGIASRHRSSPQHVGRTRRPRRARRAPAAASRPGVDRGRYGARRRRLGARHHRRATARPGSRRACRRRRTSRGAMATVRPSDRKQRRHGAVGDGPRRRLQSATARAVSRARARRGDRAGRRADQGGRRDAEPTGSSGVWRCSKDAFRATSRSSP